MNNQSKSLFQKDLYSSFCEESLHDIEHIERSKHLKHLKKKSLFELRPSKPSEIIKSSVNQSLSAID